MTLTVRAWPRSRAFSKEINQAMGSEPKKTALEVIGKLCDVGIDDGRLVGSLAITDAIAGMLEALRGSGGDFLPNLILGGKTCGGAPADLVGKDVRVEFHPAHRLFYADFRAFLADQRNVREGPPGTGFYLQSTGSVLWDDYSETDRPEMATYLSIVALNKKLRDLADHKQANTCVFLGSTKVSVDLRLTEELLHAVTESDGEYVAAVVDKVTSGPHQATKKDILRSRLVKLADMHGPEDLYTSLIGNLEAFCGGFLADYELFANDISIDKLRDTFQEKKNEYIKRINDTVTAVQGRLVSIPVATILAVSQMKSGAMALNWGILVATAIVSALVLVSLGFQSQDLSLLLSEIRAFDAKLAGTPFTKATLAGTISELRRKIIFHRGVMVLMVALVLLAFSFNWLYMFRIL